MNEFDKKLEKYAELIIKVGLNIQKGQPLLIIAPPIEVAGFVRKLVKKAYEAGAKHVYIDWSDDEINRMKYELAPSDAFEEYPSWKTLERNELVEQGAAFLSISASNPDLLNGIDSERINNFQKVAGKGLHKFRQAVQSDKISWNVAAAATQSWADKVFPNEDDNVNKLWEAIFHAVRINEENPVDAWKHHDDNLNKKAKELTERAYKKLHYKAPGTDLTIELSPKHQWMGAGSVNEKGIPFLANIPTEEVFTVPSKNGVNGTVSSTKPLSHAGTVIDKFTLTFENGRITEVAAEQGETVLKDLVGTDEGSHYIGEVALVAHKSPISETNILFYNTLFDENASNHLAIGSGYAFCIEGGKTMSQDQLEENGVNTSLVHVDFMIGSDKMDIDGELADGTLEPIFRDGNWVN